MSTSTRATWHARVRPWARFRPDLVLGVVLAAVLAGTVLRLVGLAWGLPLGLHPDEGVIVTGALDLARRNSFEPAYFMRPDHLEIQLSYLAYQAWSHLVAHQGVDAAYAEDPGAFLLISRSITAVFGIAMIVLAYLIGRRFDRRIGAIAAVLFALLPIFVRDSHYATPDIPLACTSMVVVLALMHYLARPHLVPLLVASVAISAGIAIKYPAAIATLMVAVVVVLAALRERRPLRILQHGAVSALTVVVALFVISPVLFTNLAEVRSELAGQAGADHPGADGFGWGANLLFYARTFLTGSGVLVCLAAVAGVVAACRLRMLQAVPVALGLVYWAALSVLELHWDRWGIPMFTAPLLFASIGAFHLYRWVGARRWRAPVAWVVGALVVMNLLAGSVLRDSFFHAQDSRAAALEYTRSTGITTRNAAYEGYTPLLPGAVRAVFGDFTTVDGHLRPRDPQVRYLVLSSCMSDRYDDLPRFADERAFYAAVRRDFTLLESWEGVGTGGSTGLEPLDIPRAASKAYDYWSGALASCHIRIYAVD